jgi:hypothetical protein
MFSARPCLPLAAFGLTAPAESPQTPLLPPSCAFTAELLPSLPAPASPLFATLAAPLQLTENPATLSPAFATLTRFPCPKSFTCHSYAKLPGGGVSAPPQASSCVPNIPSASLFFHSQYASRHLQAPATLFLSSVYSHFPSPRGGWWARTRKCESHLLHPSPLLPASSHRSLLTVHYSRASATLVPRSALSTSRGANTRL